MMIQNTKSKFIKTTIIFLVYAVIKQKKTRNAFSNNR
jgi:hypothetical protein